MKNLTILFATILVLTGFFYDSPVFAQTNPAAQLLPYYQNFSSLSYISKTYPAGLQGGFINNTPSSAFSFDSPSIDASMTASGTASSSIKGVYNYNSKIGFLNGTDGDYCITLAVNTTGNTNLLVEYDIMTLRNPYNNSTNNRENGVELQYRVGITGLFKSVNSRVYINNTTNQISSVTTGQNVETYSVKLPAECENQSVVQLRWITRQVNGAGSMPSFAIDNIDVEANGGKAIYYYYKGSGSLMSTTSWGVNSNGSGAQPVNFTADRQFFVIKNISQLGFDGLWTVSGINSKIILGDGINAITFTTVRNGQINGVMDMEKYSTLVISQSTSNLVTFGNLYPGSAIQVLFTASLPYLQAEATYENLLLNSSSNSTYQFTIPSPNILIKKNFTLISTLLENSGTDKFRFQVGGDITLGGTAALGSNFSNLAELVVNGTTNQTLTSNGLAMNLNRLTVDNNNSGKLTLSATGGSSNINISSGLSPVLNLSGGNIELGTNTVTLGASATSPGTMVYSSGYFTGTGTFSRWFSNTGLPITLTTLFPMGNDTNNRNVQMSFSTANITSGGKLSVSHSNITGFTMMAQPFFESSLRIDRRSNMQWAITQSGGWNLGSSTISMRINASGLPSVNHVTDLSLVLNSSAAGGTYSAGTGTLAFPQVNRSGMSITSLGGTTQANTFYIGSTVDSPLPVELSSFSSIIKDRNVKLSWTTESEVNNSGFNIERCQEDSKPGNFTAWEKISFVEGNGTSNQSHIYNYSDAGLNSGKYKYRLKQIDYNGNSEYFVLQNSQEITIGKPAAFELSQNYPNPSNPQSKINYQVPFAGKVSIKVYELTGKEVATLIDANQEAGFYSVVFNGVNLSSGVYFYRIIAEGGDQAFTKTMKMILVK